MGGPGGRAPGHGATIFFKRFPPRIVSVRGPCKNFARGTPLCYEACEKGGLAKLVSWVGAHWFGAVRRKFCKGSSH